MEKINKHKKKHKNIHICMKVCEHKIMNNFKFLEEWFIMIREIMEFLLIFDVMKHKKKLIISVET